MVLCMTLITLTTLTLNPIAQSYTTSAVQATLKHAVEALMLEDNVAVLGLQPAVGRLANALVAVLGPELTLGSPAYCSCRALIREMQVESS